MMQAQIPSLYRGSNIDDQHFDVSYWLDDVVAGASDDLTSDDVFVEDSEEDAMSSKKAPVRLI